MGQIEDYINILGIRILHQREHQAVPVVVSVPEHTR